MRVNQSVDNTPSGKGKKIAKEDEQEISKQLAQIEKEHAGLNESMSEITSKINPVKAKDLHNQNNIVDEQTNESVTLNKRNTSSKKVDPQLYEKLMQSNDMTEEKPKRKFLDMLLAQNQQLDSQDEQPLLPFNNQIRKVNVRITPID